MKSLLRCSGLLVLWYMGLFTVQRHLFLAFAHRQLHGITQQEILDCHLHGLALDLSVTGYVMLGAALLVLPLLFTTATWLRKALRIYLTVTLVLFSMVLVADIGLFDAWGVKMDRKALSYLRYPAEVAGSLSAGRMGLLFLVAGVQVLLFLFLRRRINLEADLRQGPLRGRLATAILLPTLCLLAARGGPQDLPINKSWAWFSPHPVLNLAALNSQWNLLEILVEPAEYERNPYAFMPADEAEHILRQQHPVTGGPDLHLTGLERPNILLIMLESWTAGVIEPLGGDSGVTPQFTRWCKEGLLFTNFHSTGFRTEQGLCALISGFPSQPTTTVIRKFGKFDHLPSLVRTLDSAGYSSRYYYAGDVSFANTRAYLDAMGLETIYDEHAFPIRRRTRWGAFDEELFNFHLRDAGSATRPFFQVIMTSTSHEPFDAPVDEGFSGSEAQLYRNTVHYTDRCLGTFLDSAKKQTWYDSTLVFIVADHGHYLPHHLSQFSDARHRIPFLVTGGALAPGLRGGQDGTYGSHVDFPVTLLSQLDLPRTAFPWGRDLLSKYTPHSAFWTFNNGFGMADSSQEVVFDADGKRMIELRDSTRQADAQRLLRNGQATLQTLLDRYIDFDQ